ncbi:hypothetical protein [[Mycobacterium] fortunisiensis]|uniref:hypothetical protein n=1 Tax=[Mycobacterium] fortunisiensis TaxID=2600579 RepID=UPI0027DEC640|nr:hypothetical protein [[Mycobacterium] fortunisiensis]
MWRLAALPFTDGGTGLSLAISHCITDGVGLWEAVADASLGRVDPICWPPAASRTWWQAVRQDARQTMRDIPDIGRAIAASITLARGGRDTAEPAAPPPSKSPAPASPGNESDILPTATVFVDAAAWEARAQSLGGTSNTLLVGLAARLAQRAGRVATDGSVVVTLPVNERTEGDTRANAISGVRATVDPAPAATDLREIRAAVKQALIRHQEVPDPQDFLNALVPLLPRRFLSAARGATRGNPFNLVGASNVGVIAAAAARPDGADTDRFALRLHHLGVAPATMQRYGGVQTLLAGTVQGRIFISLISCLPGRSNSKDDLHQDLSSALSEYSLTGTYL